MGRFTGSLLLMLAALGFVALIAFHAAAQSFTPDNGEDRDDDESSEEVDPEERALLEWSFEEGDEFYLRETDTQIQEQSFGGQQDRNEQTTTTYVSYTVTSVDDEGVATFLSTFEAIVLHMKTDTHELEYDSRNPDHAEMEELPDVRPVAMLVGESIRFDVDAEGDVSNVKGYSDIFSELVEELRREAPEFADLFGTMFSNEFMEQQLQEMFDILPGEEVTRGDEWEQSGEQALPGLGSLHYENTVTYEGNERSGDAELAKLSTTGTMELVPVEDSPIFPEDTEISMKNAETGGTLLYNSEIGWFERMETSMSMEMTITLGPGMELVQEQENTSDMQRLNAEEWREALGLEDEDKE